MKNEQLDCACIVTGGAGGMGVQICRKLLENEIAKLAIVDIQSEPANILDELRNRFPKTEILYFQTDVTLKDELETTFKEVRETFESIDILINAAGIFNDRDVELTFKVNVFGMINATVSGVELMNKEKRKSAVDGIIINIASVVGLDPYHILPVYTASKHAIVGFSRAYSHETYYSKSGVKIVILCPGATVTQFVRQFVGNMIYPEEREALQLLRTIPQQSVESVSEHVIEVIKTAKNGSVWLSDNGKLSEITMKTYCL